MELKNRQNGNTHNGNMQMYDNINHNKKNKQNRHTDSMSISDNQSLSDNSLSQMQMTEGKINIMNKTNDVVRKIHNRLDNDSSVKSFSINKSKNKNKKKKYKKSDIKKLHKLKKMLKEPTILYIIYILFSINSIKKIVARTIPQIKYNSDITFIEDLGSSMLYGIIFVVIFIIARIIFL
jgi:hypothetical protein